SICLRTSYATFGKMECKPVITRIHGGDRKVDENPGRKYGDVDRASCHGGQHISTAVEYSCHGRITCYCRRVLFPGFLDANCATCGTEYPFDGLDYSHCVQCHPSAVLWFLSPSGAGSLFWVYAGMDTEYMGPRIGAFCE